MKGAITKVYRWVDDRVPLTTLIETARHKEVPRHRFSLFYYFGGMTLFLFGVQVVTGILLMLYYRPSADEAFESVEFIMTTVPFGWLMRSIHAWAAHLMIYFACLHLASVYFLKAYRPPREMTWISGMLLLFLALGFGFSGYLLPWDELAFFATKVGTEMAGAVPVAGDHLVRFLRGGDHVTGGTLSRFYGWHVAILPALTTVLIAAHLFLVQVQGMSVPPGAEKEAGRRRPMRFFPHFALRELFGWILALALLAGFAAFFPWELGEKADPFAPAPPGIQPEWYFMFMFETLKLFPGGEIMGMGFEAIPILLFAVGALILVLIPFLDRNIVTKGRSPGYTIAGWIVVVYMIGMTAWGYRSWSPLYVVVLTLLMVAILSWGTRHKIGGSE
jgi:cytochrome b6